MNPNFRDLLATLSAEGAEFLVVGAYALGVHGLLRMTGDLDIWVRPSDENAQRVWNGLVRFRAPLSTVTRADFAVPDIVFRFGVQPSQVDILTTISGVSFDEAWANRVEHEVEGIKVSILNVQELIKNKRSAGRPKDLADVDWLERHKLKN